MQPWHFRIIPSFNKNWKSCISSNTKKLSKVERNNLDYYRGRFAVKSKKKVLCIDGAEDTKKNNEKEIIY